MKIYWFAVLFLWNALFPLSAQTNWHDPFKSKETVVQGRGWSREIGNVYHRFPERTERMLRKPVWELSKQSAGLYIQFRTNAPTIQVKYTVASASLSMPHMPATGVSGVDLYAMDADGNNLWCAGRYAFGDTIRYTYDGLVYRNPHDKGNEYCLYLPLYNEVKSLEIGVPGSSLFEFLKPTAEKPLVIYGTSIAQGACASRPGMAWSNILQRKLDMPVVNLGFSGNGRLEKELFLMLSELDTSLFIIDCMPNMTNGDRVGLIPQRLEEGIRILRKKSNAPILLVEHDGYMGYQVSDGKKREFERANEQLRLCYERLKGDIEGLHYMSFEEIGMDMDGQVDGVHPSDLGMTRYAEAYIQKVTEILFPEKQKLPFKPCRQHRDLNTYSWLERHEKVLHYNKELQPEIVMLGNSITHFWGGSPSSKKFADDVWQKMFQSKKVVNMGFGWDRIENVYWRILHGELDGYTPKKIFMMLGTNNLAANTDGEIIEGIKQVVRLVQKKQPDTRLYVVKILPRRGFEPRLRHLNQKLERELQQEKNVKVLDLSAPLLQKDGKIKESLFLDGLHPNHKGYAALAELLREEVQR